LPDADPAIFAGNQNLPFPDGHQSYFFTLYGYYISNSYIFLPKCSKVNKSCQFYK
jgi:hypothetical protein